MIQIPAINRRIKEIANTFGTKSEVYIKVTKYIKHEVDTKYLSDKNGYLQFRQTKETKEAIKNGDLMHWHSDDLDYQIPKVEKIIREQLNDFKDSSSFKDQELGKAKVKDVRAIITEDPKSVLAQRYLKPIEKTYEFMNDFKNIKIEVYNVRDNKKGLAAHIYFAERFKERAVDLVDRIENSSEWVREASVLIGDYYDAINRDKGITTAHKYGLIV